ncbi:MAG: FG-GAP-like repeat-containing protein [Nonlabens sp.]|uniref:FG-GAP-like repeat-containing protein n=1 Tax=Nonlabens sp. TaxID=1888209 RepID=UPI003EF4B028
MKRVLLIALLIFTSALLKAQCNVVYVNQNATGLNDGSSWSDAYISLQDAIVDANSCTGNSQIWVASGTYKPSSTSGLQPNGNALTSRNNTFLITGEIEVYGSFTGTETDINQRVIAVNRTVLSGDIGTQNDNADNTYHVLTAIAHAGSPIIIDGFSIENGHANTFSTSQFLYGSNLFSLISNNFGAGVFTEGEIIYKNTVFRNNIADYGGAIGSSHFSSATVENCVFENNMGTAMFVTNGNAYVTNSVFKDNSTGDIGIFTSSNAFMEVTNCTFFQSVAGSTTNGYRINIEEEFGADLSNNITVNNSLLYNTNDVILAFNGSSISSQDPFIDSSDPDGPDNLWGTADDGLRLAFNSGLFDVGTNGLTYQLATDIKGDPRVFNNTIDYGAYEEQVAQAPCVAGFVSCSTTVSISVDAAGCTFDSSQLVAPVSNNCFQSIVTNDAPATLPLGDTTVIWTIDDQGVIDTCTQVVTIIDAVAPSAFAKAVTLQLDNTGNATLDPNLVNDNSIDNCGIASMTVIPNTFDCTTAGDQTVTLTVTDAAGNTDTATAVVNVQTGGQVEIAFSDNQHSIIGLNTAFGDIQIQKQINEDLNGDGKVDFIVNGYSQSAGQYVTKTILNNGPQSYIVVTGNSFPVGSSISIDLGDVNGDGYSDLVMSGYGNTTNAPFTNVYLNDGNGVFTITANTAIVASYAGNVKFANLNGDSYLDLVTIGYSTAINSWISKSYSNDGTGAFTEILNPNIPILSNGALVLKDVTGDGVDDMFISGSLNVAPYGSTSALYFNDGNGVFTLNQTLENYYSAFDTMKDINGDGYEDIFTYGYNNSINSNEAKIYLNDGQNNFVSSSILMDMQNINDLKFLDTDGDSDLDVFLTGYDGSETIADIYSNENLVFNRLNLEDFDGLTSFSNLQVVDINGDDSEDLLFRAYTNPGFIEVQSVLFNDSGLVTVFPATQDITVMLDSSGVASITPQQIDNASIASCGIASLSLDQTTFDCADAAFDNNQGLAFNGIDERVEITNNNANKILGPYTMSAWVNWDDTGNSNIQYPVSKPSNFNGTGNSIVIRTSDNTVGMTYVSSTNNAPASVTSPANAITTGSWTHIAVSYDGTNGNVYVNGVLVVSQAISMSNNNSNEALYIGVEGRGSILEQRDFKGEIDEVRLWDEARTEAQIAADMNQQIQPQSGLVALYRFNEGSGTVVEDASQSNVSGTLINMDDTNRGAGAPAQSLQGVNEVTLTVTNNSGESRTATALITVQEAIPVVLTQDITVNLDATGNAVITPQDIDNGSAAGCNAITSLTLDRDTFTCADTATPVTVTLFMQDDAGVTTTGTAQVTVVDPALPTAIAQDITVSLDENGNVVLDAIDLDNGSAAGCSIIVNRTVTPASLDCTNIGANMVTLTVTDGNGNTDSTNAIVTVIDDLGPQINIPATYNVQLDPQTGIGQLTAQDLDLGTVDNCGGALTNTLSQTQFTCNIPQDEFAYNMGSQSFNLEVTSFHAKFDTNFSGPLFFRPETSSSLHNSRSAVITQSGISYGSEFGSALVAFPFQSGTWYKIQLSTSESFIQDANPQSGTVVMEIYLDLTVDDVYIGRSTHRFTQGLFGYNNGGMQFRPIKGLVDNLSTASETFTFDEGTGNIATSTAGNTLPVDSNNFVPAELNLIPDGIMVDFISTDGSGNQSIQQVEVITDDLGAVAVSQDITVNLDSGGNITLAGEDVDGGSYSGCNQDVPIASYSVSPNSFDCTNLGPNTVTLTVTDNNGNTNTTSAIVTVELNDSSPSTFSQLNLTGINASAVTGIDTGDINNDGLMDVFLTDSTIGNIKVYIQQPDGSYVLETTTISNYSSILTDFRNPRLLDFNGDGFLDILLSGIDNSLAQFGTLLLLRDNSNGSYNASWETSGLQQIINILDIDNNGVDDLLVFTRTTASTSARTFTYDPVNGGINISSTGLLVSYADDIIQVVDIDNDGDDDVITKDTTIGSAFSLLNDGSGNFSSGPILGPIFNSDFLVGDFNGDGILDQINSAALNQGANVTYNIAMSNNGGFNIFNYDSLIAGTPVQSEAYDFNNDGKDELVLNGYNGNLTQFILEWDEFNGFQDVTSSFPPYGAYDVNDFDGDGDLDMFRTNSGAFQYYENNPPSSINILLQDINVSLDSTGTATITADDVDNGSTTVCGFASRTLSQDTFSCADLGVPVPVTVTFTTLSGITDSAIAMVTVVDDTAPVITLNGNATETVPQSPTYTDPGATALDNCTDPITVVVSGDTVDPNVIGVYTITYTATDASGNTVSVDRIVTVEDSIPPSTTAVSIQSDNVNSAFAKAGDLLTLTFTTSEEVQTPIVTLAMVNAAVSATANPNEWIATTFVPNTMSIDMTALPDGVAPFVISLQDLNGNYNLVPQTATTNGSEVILDRTAPVVNAMNDFISLDISGNGIFDINAITASIADAHNFTTSTDVTTIDCSLLGANAFTLYATDEAGNVGQDLFILTVLDGLAPVMTRNGNTTVTIDRGLTYTDAGVTITDNCSSGLTPVIGGDVVDTNISGTYEVTYDVSDASGNAAPQLVRTVIVENPDFIYENSAWTPNDPSDINNPAGLDDTVIVRQDVMVSGDFRAHDLLIDSGVTLSLATDVEVIIDNDCDGDINGPNAIIIAYGQTIANTWNGGSGSIIGRLHLANANLVLTGTYRIIDRLSNDDTSSTSIIDASTADFTFVSTATQTAVVDGANITVLGEVTVEQYYADRRAFRFVSSPLTSTSTIFDNWQEGGLNPGDAGYEAGYGTHITGSGGAANGFDPTASNNGSIYGWDNVNQSWTTISSTNNPTDVLIPGNYSRLFIRGDRNIDLTQNSSHSSTTLRMKGSLLNTSYSLPAIAANVDEFIIVGNPYQMEVPLGQAMEDLFNLNSSDISAVLPNFYYMWEPMANTRGAYRIYDRQTNSIIGPQVSNSRYIPGVLKPGQSVFFASSGVSNGSFILNRPDNATGPPIFTPSIANFNATLALKLYKSTDYNQGLNELDALLIRFNVGSNNLVDQFDAIKFNNIDETLGRQHISGDRLSIENRDIPLNGDALEIHTSQYRHANYTFEIPAIGFSTKKAILEDTFTGTLTELSNSTSTVYNFIVDVNNAQSSALDRFRIVFEDITLSTAQAEFNQAVEVYPNPVVDDKFFINMAGITGEKQIKITNLVGQEIMKFKTDELGVVEVITKDFATAMYIVHISNGNRFKTVKLIVE